MDLSYDGTNYHGWQNQPNAISVQSCIEKALSLLIKAETQIFGAGRTDTGVHAMKMCAHFDSNLLLDLSKLIYDLNSFLPKDISINDIYKVNEESHARFDAISRVYDYKISLNKDVFNINRSYFINNVMDINLMNQACVILKSHTNFKCFSKSKTDVKTYDCEIVDARWVFKNGKLVFTIKANRFLRNMVRAIVGTMIQVGLKKISLDYFQEILISQDRTKAGPSAPAHALYLSNIEYPKEIRSNE